MATKFYTRVFNAAAGTLARANDVRDDFSAIETAFDSVALDTERSLKMPLGEGTDQLLNFTPNQRENTFLGFDGVGDVTLSLVAAIGDTVPLPSPANYMMRANAGAAAWEAISPATVRTNLSLQPPATAIFGTGAGQVAEGNHVHDTSSITTGILAIARGGTGVATHTDRGVIVGRAGGALEATAAGAAGIPLIGAGAANPAFGTAIVAGGGTGAVTHTDRGVLVGRGTAAVEATAQGASGIPLIGQGAANPIFGTAIVGGGGTGRATLTDRTILVGRGTAAIDQVGPGTSGQLLQSGGSGANPSYVTHNLVSHGVNATAAELNENDRSAQAITDHTMALRQYKYNAATTPGTFDVDAVISAATRETIGPTGSGATNIWTALDDAPSDVKSWDLIGTVQCNTTASPGLFIIHMMVSPDFSWAAVASQSQLYIRGNNSVSGEDWHTAGYLETACDGDGIFEVYWSQTNTSGDLVQLTYRGCGA